MVPLQPFAVQNPKNELSHDLNHNDGVLNEKYILEIHHAILYLNTYKILANKK